MFAIENGGFSSGPMPQNIVTGEEEQKVAEFVAKYSGSAVTARAAPGSGRGAAAMLDLKQIRRDPEPVRAALARRRDGSEERLDRVLELDERARALRPEVETLRARQNEASKAIGAAKQEGRDAAAEIAAMQEVAARVKALGQELADADAELQSALGSLPNPPDPTAADDGHDAARGGRGRRAPGRDHLERRRAR